MKSRLLTQTKKQPAKFSRKGAIVALMAVLLPILIILASFAINVAYLQLSRTELMVATDASARAGGRAFSAYQDVDDAKAAASLTAANNLVAGKQLLIREADDDNEIEFGDAEPTQSSDRFVFEKIVTDSVRDGSEIANALRVTGTLDSDSETGQLDALFPTFGMRDQFNLEAQAVAMQVDRDIGLVLDRSGSMSWVTWDWPNGFSPWDWDAIDEGVDAGILEWVYYYGWWYLYYTNGNNQTSYYTHLWENYLGLGTAPQAPWDDLVAAVDVFLDVLEETDQNEQVSVATYASSATLDLSLEYDYDLVRDVLNDISPSGSTAIGYGMETGMPSLLDQLLARPYAAKTLIVMTDGMHNTGTDPVTVATTIIANYDVTIHTVTFGSGADITRMQSVAEIGGGSHYHAETGDELVDVFEEIANNLPTIVTQ